MDSFDVLRLHNIAYVQTQTAAALIEMEGMKAFNSERERHGYAPGYDETAFLCLIDKYQLGHNSVITNLTIGL